MDAEERERTEVLLLLFRMRLLTGQAMAKGVKGTTNIDYFLLPNPNLKKVITSARNMPANLLDEAKLPSARVRWVHPVWGRVQ